MSLLYQRVHLPRWHTGDSCHNEYHLYCIRAGPPCRTLLRNGAGLTLHPILELPKFICELSVRLAPARALLGCEVRDYACDHKLLMLRRIGLIDMRHKWSMGTHT
jgi:hypothetical protein